MLCTLTLTAVCVRQRAMCNVASKPMRPGEPVGFTLLRVPFFLEPDYPQGEEFEETNRTRLIRNFESGAVKDNLR